MTHLSLRQEDVREVPCQYVPMLVHNACRLCDDITLCIVRAHEAMADEAMVDIVHCLVFCVRKALAVPVGINIIDNACGLVSRLLEYYKT